MSSITKRHCEHLHAKKRAMERYGIAFSRKDHREILNLIHNNNFTNRVQQSFRVYRYDVIYNGNTIRIVLDKKRQQIITFLPLD